MSTYTQSLQQRFAQSSFKRRQLAAMKREVANLTKFHQSLSPEERLEATQRYVQDRNGLDEAKRKVLDKVFLNVKKTVPNL